MITEDYVSFETAKLLKENGFDECCHLHYHYNESFDRWLKTSEYIDSRFKKYYYPCPTFQMAMKWLREVHHIIVAIDYDYEFTDTSYCYKIYQLGENGKPERVAITGVSDRDEEEHIVGFRDYKRSYKDYATYEDAADDGIRYCLENLIMNIDVE